MRLVIKRQPHFILPFSAGACLSGSFDSQSSITFTSKPPNEPLGQLNDHETRFPPPDRAIYSGNRFRCRHSHSGRPTLTTAHHGAFTTDIHTKPAEASQVSQGPRIGNLDRILDLVSLLYCENSEIITILTCCRLSLLKRRQVRGDQCANATARILQQVVAKAKWYHVDQLLDIVRSAGARLVQAAPHEPVIGNIVRRVLGLIRDEASEDRNADELGESVSDLQSLTPVAPPPTSVPARPGPTVLVRSQTMPAGLQVSKSMFNLLSVADTLDAYSTGASTPVSLPQTTSTHALKSEIMDGIEEIMDEVNQADDQIASFADIHIYPGDFVLVVLPSPAVERYLIKAASRRRFTVLVASPDSHQVLSEAQYPTLRKKLTAAGVKMINLATNGLMAYMPKVTKVIFGAKAVFQNGGVLVDSGCCIAARAAQEYSKPVIVLSGVYKFCPQDTATHISWTQLDNPSAYVSYKDGPAVDTIDIENTVAEYLPPEFVDVYVTNL